MLACFKGTVSAKVNNLQQQLQRADIVPQPQNEQQVQKLNNLESQAWLYEGILERLGADPSANHEKIARTLEALEFKRSEILEELEPRRPRKYRVLANLQDSTRSLLASQAEKDYEQLQKIVSNVVLFARDRQPSQIILSEVTNKIATEITQSTSQISPYRLRLAYRIDELLKIISAKLILNSSSSETDNSYQAIVNELQARLSLLSREFNELLRLKHKSEYALNERVMEISRLSKNISDLHKSISNRDEDIAVLKRNIQHVAEIAKAKQLEVNKLQGLISKLESDVEHEVELNWEKQRSIDRLVDEIDQLNQQRSDLQQRLHNLSVDVENNESEVEGLQNEISQLSAYKSTLEQNLRKLYQYYQQQKDDNSQLSVQKSSLEKNLQELYQYYQQQQSEIDSLRAQLSQATTLLSSYSSSSRTQSIPKSISNEEEISVEDYENIDNKSDYKLVHVPPYNRKDGTPVRGYSYYKKRSNK